MVVKTELERLAFIDGLTGAMSKNALLSDFENRSLDNIHFIYVDIDNFKTMNTIFGIDAVDRILVHVSKTLREYCGNSQVYRVGGGQFVLVTESHFICDSSELQRLLIQPVILQELQIVVNASICVFDHDDYPQTTVTELMKLMQLTLAVEKKKGTNRLVYFGESRRAEYEEKKEIALNLYNAVKTHQFYPKFRPFVDTYTNEIIGMQAVSRWDLKGKRLRPHCFLEAAEWTGLVYDIEKDMFTEAVKFYRELKNMKDIKLSPRFKVGVHFSRYTLKRAKIEDLLSVLEEFNVRPQDIIIQTKEEYISDPEAYQRLGEFRALNFMVALDDYTNSSTSLSLLAELHVDAITLGKALLENIENDEEYMKKMNVYKLKVDISKKFDFTVIADGINTERDLKLVKELDVHIGLGRYYSRAVLKDDFVEYIKNNKKKR
jgi:diguanylate cyclase (GGDEF)-like protein